MNGLNNLRCCIERINYEDNLAKIKGSLELFKNRHKSLALMVLLGSSAEIKRALEKSGRAIPN